MSFFDRIEELKWYILACIICFFGIPVFSAILPQYAGIVQLISQTANIIVVDVTSFLCGYRQFRWYYPFIVSALFAFPAMVANLYTMDTIIATSAYYLILAFIAAGIGSIIAKIRNNTR